MTYDDGQLQPRTEPGARFAALADDHAPVFRERAAWHDRDFTLAVENIADLQASGGIAAFVPQELGGFGLQSIHDWTVAIERLGRGDASTAIALNMHLSATRALADVWRRAVADGDQAAAAAQAATLQAVVAGDLVIAGTSTEQGADVLRPESTAVASEDGYVLNGRKFFVTMSPAAQLFVINLRLPGEGASPTASASHSFRPTRPAAKPKTIGTPSACVPPAARRLCSTTAGSPPPPCGSPVRSVTGTRAC